MKTFKILEVSFLTICMTFVLYACSSMLVSVFNGINSIVELLSLCVIGSFFLFLFYAIITLVMVLWKDALTKKTI